MSRNFRKCCICLKKENSRGNRQKTFYTTFPREERRCKEWVRQVGEPDLVLLPIEKLSKIRFICSDHFEPKLFNKKKNRLSKLTIPTLNLTKPPLTDEQLKGFPLYVAQYPKGYTFDRQLEPIVDDPVVPGEHIDHQYCRTKRKYPKLPVRNGYTFDRQLKPIVDDLVVTGKHIDHLYCLSTKRKFPTLPVPNELQCPKEDVNKLDGSITETAGDLIETGIFDGDESPPSPAKDLVTDVVSEISDYIAKQEVFSWQTTELIEADEDLTPTAVPDAPKIPEDITLSLFCEPDRPESPAPIELVAVVPEDVEYHCKDCAAVIDGFEFWCVQCSSGPLRGAGAARPPHDAHYVLRAPTGATHSRTQAVLAVIRQNLLKEKLLTLYETDDDGVKVEIKWEPEERPFTPPATTSYLVEPHSDPLSVEPHCHPLELPPKPLADDHSGLITIDHSPGTIANEFVDDENDDHPFKRARMTHNRLIRPNLTVNMDGHDVQPLLNESATAAKLNTHSKILQEAIKSSITPTKETESQNVLQIDSSDSNDSHNALIDRNDPSRSQITLVDSIDPKALQTVLRTNTSDLRKLQNVLLANKESIELNTGIKTARGLRKSKTDQQVDLNDPKQSLNVLHVTPSDIKKQVDPSHTRHSEAVLQVDPIPRVSQDILQIDYRQLSRPKLDCTDRTRSLPKISRKRRQLQPGEVKPLILRMFQLLSKINSSYRTGLQSPLKVAPSERTGLQSVPRIQPSGLRNPQNPHKDQPTKLMTTRKIPGQVNEVKPREKAPNIPSCGSRQRCTRLQNDRNVVKKSQNDVKGISYPVKVTSLSVTSKAMIVNLNDEPGEEYENVEFLEEDLLDSDGEDNGLHKANHDEHIIDKNSVKGIDNDGVDLDKRKEEINRSDTDNHDTLPLSSVDTDRSSRIAKQSKVEEECNKDTH